MNRHLFKRLLARLMDFALAQIPAQLFFPQQTSDSAWLLFGLYNIVVILAEGKTLGRWALRLEVRGMKKKASRPQLLFRECVLYLFFPFVALTFLFPGARGLHESLTQTRVISDDERVSPDSLPRTRFHRL